jgi:acetyl esterase/lipase
MITERIDVYQYFGLQRKEGASGYLNTYIHALSKEYNEFRIRPAMVICPGGGYGFRSDRENEPIALKFMVEGFNSFTLEYSIEPFGYPTQLVECAMAVAYIKENAEKLSVDKDHVSVVGFSAGGHLAGSLATLFKDKFVVEYLKDKAELARPDAVILSYPVITTKKETHGGTARVVSNGKQDIREYMSLEDRVTKDSVPAFIWATVDDGCVPCENSLMMASAYKKNGVPFELHIFESGVHGLSLCTRETARTDDDELINAPVEKWFKMSMTWLKNRGFKIIG